MIPLFMDPWDDLLVPLLTCVGNSTFAVNCFFLELLKYVITGLLILQKTFLGSRVSRTANS